MGNWLNYKWLALLALPLTLAWTSQEIKIHKRWGFYGHKRINRLAIFTLPPEIFGFYKEHLEYLTEHAVDPDKRRNAVEGEAQCHYIDLDNYYTKGQNPFELIPKQWEEAVKKYTEDTLQAHGIVPWHIHVMKNKLQKAFETHNVDLILKYSADIGHYIGDAHVPLHTTKNYNGQLTGQKGIHGLWESRLVELNADSYDYFVGKSKYIKNTLDLSWEAVKGSHQALDSVLGIEQQLTKEFPSDRKYSFEQRGSTTIQVYSYEFSQEYHKRLNGMVERRMRAAIMAVGSIWYTAWVDAGQPDLRLLQNVPPSATLLEEMKTMDIDFQRRKQQSRICE